MIELFFISHIYTKTANAVWPLSSLIRDYEAEIKYDHLRKPESLEPS